MSDIDKTIYLVPYAHLDTQWRWEYPTTIKKYIAATIHENIAMFDKYPDYAFNFTGALRYQMMKEYYPKEFERVRELVREGRWSPAGACLDETDALAPCAESLMRNVLYGNRWQRQEFGVSSRDYMLPDCFGFPANFPSILRHMGVVGFSSQKLTWNSAQGIPFVLGNWRGADGAELVCAFNPCSYVSILTGAVQDSQKRVERLNELGEKNGVWKSYQYYGVGDIGGAPQEMSIKHASESMATDKNGIHVAQGASDAFFLSLTDEEKARLDTYSGDLLLINHSAGSLSSAAIMKRWNRQNEQLARTAEFSAALAETVAGQSYPEERIRRAWQRVIGNQMHDILPGTCTPTAYNYSQNDEVVALLEWQSIIEDSVRAVAPYISGSGNILVVNSFEKRISVPIELKIDGVRAGKAYTLTNSRGDSYSAAAVERDGETILVAAPTVSAMSIERFALSEGQPATDTDTDFALLRANGGYVLRNKYLSVTITADGEITSICDKTTAKEFLAKPLAYHLQHERPTKYPAWNMDWADRQKPPKKVISSGRVEVTEDNAVRKTVVITARVGSSVFKKSVSLCAESRQVDFVEHIHWRERGVSLKLAVTSPYHDKFVTNWETCTVSHEVNNEKCFEMPSRYWAELRGEEYALSILESSKYGYDRPTADTMRLTLLYTPHVRRTAGFWDQRWQDHGEHTIRYSLYPHATTISATAAAKAFNTPPRAYLTDNELPTYSADHKPTTLFELLSSCDNDVYVSALKRAEDGSGYILRLFSAEGKGYSGILQPYFPTENVYTVDGMEENPVPVTLFNLGYEVIVPKGGITTLLLRFSEAPKVSEYESAVQPINGDTQITFDARTATGFLPAQQIPDSIPCGGFSFAPAKKAIRADGMTIDIPTGHNTLSLLVSSTEADTLTAVTIGGERSTTAKYGIFASRGFIGQFDTRLWLKKPRHMDKCKRDYVWANYCTGIREGYVSRGKIGWYTTHTVNNGEVKPYEYGYLQRVDIYVGDATAVKLSASKAVIAAVTTYTAPCSIRDITLHEKYDF